MASRAHKHSANKALAFIMASDINDSFGDESSLESSDSHNSEEVPYFSCLEVDKRQENDTQVCFKNYYFYFLFDKAFDVSSLFGVDKAVVILVQFSYNSYFFSSVLL